VSPKTQAILDQQRALFEPEFLCWRVVRYPVLASIAGEQKADTFGSGGFGYFRRNESASPVGARTRLQA